MIPTPEISSQALLHNLLPRRATCRPGSEKFIKNGSIHNGKPKFSCRECRRQFAENSSNKTIPQKTWNLDDKLLLEKISAAGIARAAGLSEAWIQQYVNKTYENILKESGAVFLECDEMWPFVGSKKNKVWIWLVIYRETRSMRQ